MNLRLFITVTVFTVLTSVQAFDTKLLYNDKQFNSNLVTDEQVQLAKNYIQDLQVEPQAMKDLLLNVISRSIDKIQSYKKICDLRLIKELRARIKNKNLPYDQESLDHFAVFLRGEELIDDLFYEMITSRNKIYNDLDNISDLTRVDRFETIPRKVKRSDILKTYEKLGNSLPEGKNKCIINTWSDQMYNVSDAYYIDLSSYKKISKMAKKSNYWAFKRGVITKEFLAKLEYLRESDIIKKRLSLRKYLTITTLSKNKYSEELAYLKSTYVPDVYPEQATSFTDTLLDRRAYMTRRKSLFLKYDENQIMLLGHTLVKAAKRINSFKAEIHFHYKEDSSDEKDYEIYVIPPASQRRVALDLLKSDITKHYSSQTMEGKSVSYEDIVMAGLETGVFTLSELDTFIGYENFWKQARPRWKVAIDLLFGFTGRAVYFLPPPWNVVGAITTIIGEMKYYKSQRKVNHEGNYNAPF